MTLVGEKEEKANTIQPPFLCFFSPSVSKTCPLGSKNKTDFGRMKIKYFTFWLKWKMFWKLNNILVILIVMKWI